MLELSHRLLPGSGSTIVFVHGFLGSSNQWDKIVSHLKDYHQILLIDLPGHGNYGQSLVYSIDNVSDCINSILQKREIEQIHFVGHSMGGYVGCAFAEAYSEKTLSLHLLNSCATADSEQRRLQRDRSIDLVDKYPTAFISMAIANLFSSEERDTYKQEIDNIKKEAGKISTQSIKQAIIAMRDRTSQIDHLQKSSIPITHIYGQHDLIMPMETIVDEIHILNSTSIKLDSGHMSLITHTQEIIENLHFTD